MRELFPGFYKRSEEELSKFWQEGIFVFDTNMLLNVYRYAPKTRDRYFEILDLLKKRSQLWIPYQVAYEYQDRRMDVIRGQLDPYTKVSDILQTTWQKLDSSLEPYKSKHGFIDTTELAKQLTNAIKQAKATVTQDNQKYKRENEALIKHDKLLEKLEKLFQGTIGKPYSSSRLNELYGQAQLRVELQIPPGWEDEGKNSFKAFGDIILWFQLLDYARTQKKPIILVTDDGKKDWWIRDSKGKPMKPLPALVQEMFVEAGVLLHMYQGYEFLEQAEHFLNLEEKPDIIADALEVTKQNIAEINQVKHGISVGKLRDYYSAESAVQDWLQLTYSQGHEITVNPIEGPDFIVVEPDGTRIGIEVKYMSGRYPMSVLINQLGLVHRRRKGMPLDKFLMVLVCKDAKNVSTLTMIIQQTIEIPESISFVIGYLDSEGKFLVFSKLP